MDGLKNRLMDSIQLRLSFGLSLAILIVAVVAGVFSFSAAFDEAYQRQDDMLRHVAVLFEGQPIPAEIPDDKDSRLTVQYLGENTDTPSDLASSEALPLSPTLDNGMHTLTLTYRLGAKIKTETFRVFIKTTRNGARLAVAQETEVRDEIAHNGAMRTVMPFLILMPILLFVVGNLVRKIFRPISLLANEIDHRGDEELYPVAQGHLPAEIRPFVTAINRLLDRVAKSMEAKRRFVADAAHELRSPLTALSLQAERLADTAMSDSARERLDVLRQGIERGRRLLDQLLTLARAQSDASPPQTLISVQQIYLSLLEDLMPLAEAKKIDIGVEGENDVQLLLNETDLKTLIKNLIDNAIRYTPEGGRIDLSVSQSLDQAILQIIDSGPGIPPSERERVFDPFYRVLGSDEVGSGLGLSIVKTIANRIGAQVCLGYADEVAQTGLCARVLIPSVSSQPLVVRPPMTAEEAFLSVSCRKR